MKTKKITISILLLLVMVLSFGNLKATPTIVRFASVSFQQTAKDTFYVSIYIANKGVARDTFLYCQVPINFNSAVLNGYTPIVELVPGSSSLGAGNTALFNDYVDVANNMLVLTYGGAPNPGVAGNRKVIQPGDSICFGRFKVYLADDLPEQTFAVLPMGGTIRPNPGTNPIVKYFYARNNGPSGAGWKAYEFLGTALDAPNYQVYNDPAMNNPLPVELASFTANVIGKRDVKLSWATSSELNNSGFEIEHKLTNATEWSKAGYVAGKNTASSYTFEDKRLNSGKYNYRLKQIDINGNFKYHALANEVEVGVPTKFDLSQNYPNPFNPVTKIDYDLPFDSRVKMVIFDITGRELMTLVNEVQTAGYYTHQFNASSLSSGTYFYRIEAIGGTNYLMTKKMVLIK